MLNQYFNENCLDTMNRMQDEYVDLVVTSPPYDALRTYDGHVDAFDFETISQELYRVVKPGGVIVWVVADQVENDNESGTSFKQALHFQKIGFNLFDTVFDATSNLYYFPEKWMLRTNEERTELKQVCQQIVAEFDTRLLEPDRQKR